MKICQFLSIKGVNENTEKKMLMVLMKALINTEGKVLMSWEGVNEGVNKY